MRYYRAGSSQLVAPLLCDELIGIAEALAKHRLDLVAERRHDRIVRTAIGKPRSPLRRSRVLARVAAAHGTMRVLEQAVRAASSALALGVGVRDICVGRVQVFFG